MKKTKKGIAVMMAALMAAGLLGGCSSKNPDASAGTSAGTTAAKTTAGTTAEAGKTTAEQTTGETEAQKQELPDGVKPLEAERPTLKMLVPYTTADMNHDIAGKRTEEISGYHVEYEVLPQDNAEQQLLLSVSGESEYDIIKLNDSQFAKLMSQGALADLTDYISVYGDNLAKLNSELALNSTSDENGRIFGLSSEYGASPSDPYGTVQKGLAIRTDIMDELGLTPPETKDEFVTFLKAIKEATGVAPLTFTKNGFLDSVILTAFYDLGNSWVERDGTIMNRFRCPEMAEYLAFMTDLYAQGLIDAEFAVNATSNTVEKVASGNAYITPAWFYDIQTLIDACKAAGSETGFYMLGGIKPDADTPATYVNFISLGNIYAVPRNSKHIADAVNYLNIISDDDNFLKIYLGDEGVSYEVKDGKYYPLFPGFNDYQNAGQYKGLTGEGKEFSYWCARARKTDVMAAAFAQMNDPLKDSNVLTTYVAYAYAKPETSVRSALNNAVFDAMLTAIVENKDSEEAMAEIIKDYEANGGTELDQVMAQWYADNYEVIQANSKK